MIIRRFGLGLALLVLLGAAASPSVWAGRDGERGHGHAHQHGGFSVFLGAPWPRHYYPYPAYFDSPLVVVPSAPPVYIEREPDTAAQASAYWYFCNSPAGYYPYVKECAGGWQKVAPQPQASPQ